MNAPGSVNVPPSGLSTRTATAPPEPPGGGGGTGKLIRPGVRKVGKIVACVGPGLKVSVAPGWKFEPETRYGPGAEARFGEIAVSTGPSTIFSAYWRIVVCPASSVTWTVRTKFPNAVGPGFGGFTRTWPSPVTSMP